MGHHRLNVSVVVKAGSCHGCGVCAAVCIQGAIEMHVFSPGIFQPVIDTDKCKRCGLCLDICSGKKHIGGESLLGNVEKVWTGHSTNPEIRRNSASGGIVSGILVELMERGTLDGAVINVPDPERPLHGKSILATSKRDVMYGAKSIYGMTEIGNGLRIAAHNPAIKKIAVVGLPCQMASVRNMLSKGGPLFKKVKLLIGIMDGHNVYHAATEDALRMSGIDLDSVGEVRYRAKGWSPFSYSIELLNKERKEFPWPKSSFQKIWDSFSLRPFPCLICNDFAAEHSDIACADAWLDEYKGNQDGYSIILAHTEAGKKVVEGLEKGNSLELIERDPSCIGRSQYIQLDYKKRTSYLRSIILGTRKENIPPCSGRISSEDYHAELSNIKNNISSLSSRGESLNLDGGSIHATQKHCIDKVLSDVKCQSTGLPPMKADVVFKPDILEPGRIEDEAGIPRRILFCGTGYGAGNIGDDAILSGLIRSTRTHLPEAEIGVISFSPEFTKNTVDIEKVWPFNNEGAVRALQWSTHVVLGGATLISEKPNLGYPLGYCAGLIKTAVDLKKPVCMLAVGTSDILSQQAEDLIRNYYNEFLDIITVRSGEDKKIASSLSIDPERLFVCADAAFAADYSMKQREKEGLSKNVIGLSLVNEGLSNQYPHIDAISHALTKLKKKYSDIEVLGLCSETRKESAYDYPLLQQVVGSGLGGDVFCEYVSPLEFSEKLSECRLVITMRMHILVFCAILGIPCIPIVREKKTELMARELGLDHLLYLNNSSQEMEGLIERVLCRPHEAVVNREKIAELEQRALDNGKFLKQWIDGGFGAYRALVSHYAEAGSVLYIRTDSIGDNILAASMLPYIREKYKTAKITVVCQKHIAEIYEICPFVDDIITFDRQRALQDEKYRSSIVQRLRVLNADLALNSVYSREPLTDVFAIESGARERIAFDGNLCNIPAEIRDRHNQFYSRLLPSSEEHKPELERHRDFLKGLGIDVPSLHPIMWTTSEDEKFADDFFTSNDLQPRKTIALFVGAQFEAKVYTQYNLALSEIYKDRNLTIIAFGSESDYSINQEALNSNRQHTINLCGKTTLRQTAALLKRCRLAVGADTGTAHIACAVGIPNVILLGGGHFGRFIPYSPLTSVVCLPLDCYDCNWRCKYQTTHCVKDIAPEVITEAVRQTLEKSSERPRVFMQGSSLWNQGAGQPKWKIFDAFLKIDSVEIISIGEIPSGIHENQQGEDLFNKGDTDGALNVFTKAIEINPNFATAYNNLGVLYWQAGEVQKAVEHFARALEIDPNDRDTILNCGDLFKSLGKYEDARNIYSSYLCQNPDDEEIARSLADSQDKRAVEVSDEGCEYLVSAIVSTYNSERFIRGCLEDLEAQTIADRLEIVVVNSGSEQNEEAIVKEFQEKYSNIKYIRTDQRETVYAAWNRGVKASSGKYITNANTDDRRRADACEQMVKALEGKPDIALVYADVIITENENETFNKCTPVGSYRWLDWSRDHLLGKGCFMGPQPMWRRTLHDEYGYFDDTLVTSGDYEFWLRVSQTNSFLHIRDMLGLYLKSPESVEHSNSKRQAKENERILSMYRKAAAKGDIIRRFYSDDGTDLIGVHNRKAEELFQSGNIEGAKGILEQICSRDPRLVEPLNNLGVIAFQEGKMNEAASRFIRVLEIDPDYFESIENLGKCEEAKKDYLKAAQWFERALSLKPKEIGLLNSLGNCFIQMEELGNARGAYEESLRLGGGQEDIKVILWELERLEEAQNGKRSHVKA
ncbi:MAG: polysaccharide pyruvyl transferase family protein [Deltaproteobacteria bacterium]|nr:polysaccharide pyruvyl transferase family protein [Deltaproteobacteria bacterium]